MSKVGERGTIHLIIIWNVVAILVVLLNSLLLSEFYTDSHAWIVLDLTIMKFQWLKIVSFRCCTKLLKTTSSLPISSCGVGMCIYKYILWGCMSDFKSRISAKIQNFHLSEYFLFRIFTCSNFMNFFPITQ